MSCAEYEGSEFYGVSDGGGGCPNGHEKRTIDVSGGHAGGHGMMTGNQYEQLDYEPFEEAVAEADPSFGPIYSPASSYEYDYDCDIPSYDVGDTVDSPVDGDARYWDDSIGPMNYQVCPCLSCHAHARLPTDSFNFKTRVTALAITR